jgi:RNA polymerase sigma factor (sigma-70 family)
MRHRPTTATAHTPASYVVRFHDRLRVMLLGRGDVNDIKDVVQTECLALLDGLDDTMAAYPNPYHFAAVRAQGGRAVIDHRRRESVQRGGGAHVYDKDGNRVRGRDVLDGHDAYRDQRFDEYDDRPGKGGLAGTYFEVYAARTPDLATQFVEEVTVNDQLRQALLRATPVQRTVLLLIDGQGYTVTEAAAELGLARETVSRQRSKAYRAIRRQPLEPPC